MKNAITQAVCSFHVSLSSPRPAWDLLEPTCHGVEKELAGIASPALQFLPSFLVGNFNMVRGCKVNRFRGNIDA
ncbi:MAG: hypothetical protein ACTSUE_18215 [Promethearchaeota archaeon]